MLECSLSQNDARWDAFVLAHPAGTFFHLSKWREILCESFGYKPFYLCVEADGRVRGVLPLFLVKSLLFGKSLVGMPIVVYGGIVAEDEIAAMVLLEKAKNIARSEGVRYLEIRNNPYDAILSSSSNSLCGGGKWYRKDLYVTFLGTLDSSDELNLARIPRKQRRMVRQGEKHGLKSIFDNGRLNEFYQVYAESVRNLGTPVYGLSYFKKLVDRLNEHCKVLLIEYQGKVIAGVLSFFYKDQVLPFYGGASRRFLHLAPNDFMYWELMRYAASQGCKVFDFGRSKQNAGSYHFKRHWGFTPTPLPYWYLAQGDRPIPDTSPLNPRLQWAIHIWRSLPLKVTTVVGPQIVRHLP